jgi:hypothetical protein
MSKEQSLDRPHPLEGVDPWDCYDQHIAERNKLISAKRDAEDGFIKTIIQLSSTIVLAVPTALSVGSKTLRSPSILLDIGILLVAASLIFALLEQFLSSHAYDRQLAKTDAYYSKAISDVTAPVTSRLVRSAIVIAFVTFTVGVLVVSASLLIGPWRT